MLLWQDELNPRVRCAFGNVYGRGRLRLEKFKMFYISSDEEFVKGFTRVSLSNDLILPEKMAASRHFGQKKRIEVVLLNTHKIE